MIRVNISVVAGYTEHSIDYPPPIYHRHLPPTHLCAQLTWHTHLTTVDLVINVLYVL